jgi:hypothetical protein
MKNRTNALLAAASALLVLAALAAPASASASEWLHEGKSLKEKVEFPLTGGEFLELSEGASGSLLCNSSATMTTEGGSSALMTAYSIEKASCFGLSGELEGCTVTSAAAKGLSWGLTTTSENDLIAEKVGFEWSFNEGCSIHKIEVSFPETTVEPEKPSAIRFFHFGPKAKATVDGEKATLVDTVSLELPEEDLEKYGIG